jgi:hypothetical protein
MQLIIKQISRTSCHFHPSSVQILLPAPFCQVLSVSSSLNVRDKTLKNFRSHPCLNHFNRIPKLCNI